MIEKSLSVAFGNSLSEEAVVCISDLAEVGLDAILEEGVLKEVPILATAISIYKIGSSIAERHHLKQLVVFLNEINNGIVDESERIEYQQKFEENKKFRNQELEYIMVLLERYISYDKPQMLAKLFLAYLNNKITWIEFAKYAEIIDRLFYGDVQYLNNRVLALVDSDDVAIDSVLRLLAVGLVAQKQTRVSDDGNGGISIDSGEGYAITPLGAKLMTIL